MSYKEQQTYLFILAHSWLPLSRKKLFGYFNLYARRRQIVSREFLPLLQNKTNMQVSPYTLLQKVVSLYMLHRHVAERRYSSTDSQHKMEVHINTGVQIPQFKKAFMPRAEWPENYGSVQIFSVWKTLATREFIYPS